MDETTKDRIRREIRQERKRRKLSQLELAEMVGVAPNTIGNTERGTSFPQRSHLVAICGILGIRLDEGDQAVETPEPNSSADYGKFSTETRIVLNMLGLYLDSEPDKREERAAAITRAVMARRL